MEYLHGSLESLRRVYVNSTLPEVGIKNNIPLEHIKLIAVPEDKVEFVRKLIGDKKIIVTPISRDDRFYYVDPEFGEISFDSEKAQKLVDKKSQTEYNTKDLEKLAKTRIMSRIREIYSLVKENLRHRRKDNEENSRDR